MDNSWRQTSDTPLQLIGPELTGVVVQWGVGDILGQRVGEGQFGEHLFGPVNNGSGDHLQRDSETDLLSVVTQDGPRSAEEDKTDPGLRLKDFPLRTQRHMVITCRSRVRVRMGF